MSKKPYTVKTKGSVTVIQWENRGGKDVARPSSTGKFVDAPSKKDRGETPSPSRSKRS